MSTPHYFRPSLEALEDRVVPVSVSVSLPQDFQNINAVQQWLSGVANAITNLRNSGGSGDLPSPAQVFAMEQYVNGNVNLIGNSMSQAVNQLEAYRVLIAGAPAAAIPGLTDQLALQGIQFAALFRSLAFSLQSQVNTLGAAILEIDAQLPGFISSSFFAGTLPGFGTAGTGILAHLHGTTGGTFTALVAGSATDAFGLTNNLSGKIKFFLSGDGSLLDPFTGIVTVEGQDNVVPPGRISPLENASAPIQSNLRQIVASGSGNGFAFFFNGFVGLTGANVLGTLTVKLADGSATQMSVNATPI